MKYRVMAAGAAAIVISAVASAPTATAQTTYEMPDIKGANLAAAVASFKSATEGSGFKLNFVNRAGPGEVINLTNWTVCRQSPEAGSTLTKKSWPAAVVNRPNQC